MKLTVLSCFNRITYDVVSRMDFSRDCCKIKDFCDTGYASLSLGTCEHGTGILEDGQTVEIRRQQSETKACEYEYHTCCNGR